MTSEPLHIFDPRRNVQLQGFAGRAATTTIHDATETGVSISGIFQAAEDFAVLGWWNANDYFNHLRLKHLPKTDLSGLKLEFDIEYDQALDGAIRLDAAKYPSVSWDAMTFVTGAGDSHEVRLLDHVTVVSGSEAAATVLIDISGKENMDGGIDWLHLYFRDTRYTVTSSDCRVETQLRANVNAGDITLPVQSSAGFDTGDGIWIERTGRNEEETTVIGAGTGTIHASVSMGHPSGSFVTRKTKAWHVAKKLADIINTVGASVAGRFGPDQSGVIHAQAWASGPSTGGVTLTFALGAGATARYGKLGNLDRVFVAHGRTLAGVPVSVGQGYLAGPTSITLTTAWQRFKITGTLAAGQTGLWIVVRQFAGNGDNWTSGAIYLWGACLQQGNDPKAGYARTWASQTAAVAAGIACGATVIAAKDNAESPLRIYGPGSNLADHRLVEVTAGGELILAGGTGSGYRLAELMGATNPSGWSGVLKVKTPAGTTAGYILLYSNP